MDIPKGIEIRGDSLRIRFMWEGTNYTLTFTDLMPDEEGLHHASYVRSQVLRKLKNNTFKVEEYKDIFAEDNKLFKKFGYIIHENNDIVSDLLDKWWKLHREEYKHSSKVKIKGSIDQCKNLFGKTRIIDLEHATVDTKIKESKLQKNTLLGYLLPLKNALSWAKKEKQITKNPLLGYRLPRRERVVEKKLNETKPKINPFSDAEIEKFNCIRYKYLNNMIKFHAYTGLRIGELLALEWSDIDWKNDTVNINKHIYLGVTDTPKTEGSIRDVDLDPPVLDILRSQERMQMGRTGRIFVSHYGKKWDSAKTYNASFKRACKRVGIEVRNVYQLRHTFAIRHIDNGEAWPWIAKQMGHKNIQMLINHYGVETMKSEKGKYVRKCVAKS